MVKMAVPFKGIKFRIDKLQPWSQTTFLDILEYWVMSGWLKRYRINMQGLGGKRWSQDTKF